MFHLTGCIGVRVGNGVKVLEGIHPRAFGYTFYWHMANPESVAHMYSATTYVQMTRSPKGVTVADVAFVQFICLAPEETEEVKQQLPTTPLLGAAVMMIGMLKWRMSPTCRMPLFEAHHRNRHCKVWMRKGNVLRGIRSQEAVAQQFPLKPHRALRVGILLHPPHRNKDNQQ